ncbi:MAG TPA: Sec-independent protein translocase protein TatB [Steroidobacteraceae bacterium]|nr:Sec-independent protein translocase protein TatB [Steroidobacteraceae bacterium]
MFEGRFLEVLIIFVLALVVLGPEKLPRVTSEVGRWIGRARAMARQFREQLEEEVQLEEARRRDPPPSSTASTAAPAAAEPAAAAQPAQTPSPPNIHNSGQERPSWAAARPLSPAAAAAAPPEQPATSAPAQPDESDANTSAAATPAHSERRA